MRTIDAAELTLIFLTILQNFGGKVMESLDMEIILYLILDRALGGLARKGGRTKIFFSQVRYIYHRVTKVVADHGSEFSG